MASEAIYKITNRRHILLGEKKKKERDASLSLSLVSLTSGGSIRIERKSDWSRKHADAALFVDGLCPLEDICC